MTETVELKPLLRRVLDYIEDMPRLRPEDAHHNDRERQRELEDQRDPLIEDITAALTRSDPAVRDRVKPLEWEETFQDRGDGSSELSGWEAETPGFSVFYTIEIEVSGFLLRRQDLDVTELGAFTDPDEAKAAAQADYEQRILSALEPRTSPPEPASGLEDD